MVFTMYAPSQAQLPVLKKPIKKEEKRGLFCVATLARGTKKPSKSHRNAFGASKRWGWGLSKGWGKVHLSNSSQVKAHALMHGYRVSASSCKVVWPAVKTVWNIFQGDEFSLPLAGGFSFSRHEISGEIPIYLRFIVHNSLKDWEV